ncbi:MAG: SMP-30/gluconolactonase/LRE family protein [Psychrobium sp.]
MRKAILVGCVLATMGCAQQFQTSSDFVADGVFTQGVEGPAVDDSGRLFAVNLQRQGTIGVVDNHGDATIFLSLPNNSVGNGIRFFNGDMYIADYVNHIVWRADLKTKSLTAFARNDEMNQPNDLAVMDNGTLFASDPNWAQGTGKLWRIDQAGRIHLLADDMGTTNGIEVSPDNKILYVNESVQRKVWRFDLDTFGNVSNKRLHISFDDYGLDGMRSDKNGNLYIARYGKGVIAVVSPTGKLLREMKLTGQHPTNVAFGGEDGKTVFVTMQKRGAIEYFSAPVAGRSHLGKLASLAGK